MKVGFLIFVAVFIPVYAFGVAVDMNQPKTIRADKIEYNINTKTIKTSGKTEITTKSGQRMTLSDSYISQQTNQLSGDDIQLWLGQHVYVKSDAVTRDGDITIAKHALFTACDGCDEYGDAWTITAYELVHDLDERMLYFHSSTLWVYDVPVFWLPYFAMPDPGVKHKSGFLMPDFESTNKMGTQINIPLYISLSDTHDMTVTLSYLTQENPLFQLEHRLNTPHSEFRTRGSFTHDKAGENRWHVFNDDIIELGENTRATLFLERASDKTYLQKYGFYNAQPYLDSGAQIELFGQSGYVVADAHVFQELRSAGLTEAAPSGNILPNVRAVYQTAPIYYETYLTLNADVLGISGSNVASQRVIGDVRLVSPWTLWGGNRMTASFSTRYDMYHFDNAEMIDGDKFSGIKNRFLPSGYIEWGLPLFRPNYAWTQIIEPRARLTIMRRTDAEQFAANNDSAGAFLSDATLFSDNRFAGLDLWENGTFADYGMRWAAFNQDGQMIEVFLGQSYDLTDRAATDLNSGFHNGASDYVGRIELNNASWLTLDTRFRFGRDRLNLRHVETNAHIGKSATYLNLGHMWSQRFEDDGTINDNNNINEMMAGFGIQITNRWSVYFNSIYNMTYGDFQSHDGGVKYNHPCYYLSAGYRRDNTVKEDYTGSTTFQFRFGMNIDGKRY